MQKPSIGWQSWSPPFPSWHGFPRWDYSPFKLTALKPPFRATPGRQAKIRYWCSWYAYGWNINERKILETIEAIKKHDLPFTHLLIDDGWTAWGDWHTPNPTRFPNMTSTIKKIKTEKLKAGLWFAPFLASSKSQLYKAHPDWFVKYRGKAVQGLKTMPIWESLLPKKYLLDLDRPIVKKYLTDFVNLAITKWKVDLLKLDFLYAVYFNPHHQSDHLAHDQVTWLLSYIKRKYPHVEVVACGAPFASSIGLVDAIRISKDTAFPPVVPKLLNQLTYRSRTKMLSQKMRASDLPPSIGLDPDVRMFTLDSHATSSIWDTISTNILGVGDKLVALPLSKISKLKLWLTNHNSQ